MGISGRRNVNDHSLKHALKLSNQRGAPQSSPMPGPLTERLLRTLRFIRASTAEKGVSPTIKEIADHFGIAPPSALAQIARLESAGHIKRKPKQWRSIEVIQAPIRSDVPVREMVQIPVVGRVAAGTPILAESDIEGHLPIDAAFAKSEGALFALRVKGDSRVGADVKEDDYIIVRQQPVAHSGDVVVARLGDEGTVRRLAIRGDQIELLSENPRSKPIKVERGDEFRIVGKVLTVYRLGKQTLPPHWMPRK